MLTQDDILRALCDCFDRTLPCNIVDLGLVRSVEVIRDEDAPGSKIPGVPQKHIVRVAMVPTVTDEAAAAAMKAMVENRLAGLETVSRIEVTMLDEPTWSPRDITPAGRRTLGLDGNPSLVQIR